jgi:hypothetical protein
LIDVATSVARLFGPNVVAKASIDDVPRAPHADPMDRSSGARDTGETFV